ncbi:MAG: radical SAM family heme chaperone HemW [Lachnospiraceae bacterium]|nr:radical SAM family heme chaperone HemW [Lachnospiraceae bacterium]
MKRLGLYIHIPFCVKKCVYCDFLSAPADDMTKRRYMGALETEIRAVSELYGEYQAQTVFFGGGTPSCVDADLLAHCLAVVRDCFDVSSDAEITMEINPKTASGEKLGVLKAAGVNRLSIGLQSADDRELLLLGRIHTCADFLQTYGQARAAGFENINIDLICAIPGQSLEAWKRTLDFVIKLNPEHISAYSLIVEEGTKLYDCISQYPALPDEDTERLMYYETKRMLAQHGFARYEISNYARRGFESRHNQIYWQRGCDHISNYIGFGLGASSTIGSLRYKNTDDLREYLAYCAEPARLRRDEENLSAQELMDEFVILGLRRMEGISLPEFEKTFGVSLLSVYADSLKKWKNAGCLEEKGGFLFFTERGIDVSNTVLCDFLNV